MGALRVRVSSSAGERLAAARELLLACEPGARALVVGASRGAADDLARQVALARGATFGIQRLSLTQLAARSAMLALAADGLATSTWLGTEAVAARTVFDAARAGSLSYLAPVAETPGFARAVARTLHDLRVAGVRHERLETLALAGPDLADLLARFEAVFDEASSVDRARLFRTAAQALRAAPAAETIVLLDLALEQPIDRELVDALVEGASRVLATVPHGDHHAVSYFRSRDAEIDDAEAGDAGDLGCLRQFLFTDRTLPAQRELDGSLEFFSAPGEGREAVEIARRIMRAAARGVPFDEMAIFVRATGSYFGLIEHALRRASVPAWFDRGTRRPHPTGRAFLAILACAAEQLSAARFAEYLSLGQVPANDAAEREQWTPSRDDAFDRTPPLPEDEDETERSGLAAETPRASDPVFAGTLRAPWRWESLLVESAVIGGDAARWRRRLDGKARELERQVLEASRHEDGADSGRVRGLEQVAEQLRHLQTFALPVVETLAGWPAQARWGEWLDQFETLAPRVLRVPAFVLRVLADLRPMADVGPVDLDEVRRVLSARLLTVESEPPSRRFGRVFVGTPQQARGRSFRVVFVPGLAERMFPQKPREDPLLLDDLRAQVDEALPVQRQRLAAERLLLQLAAGAASDRLCVSYPRIELSESRARVPSFYALDVMRAATGRVPDYEVLEEKARAAGHATLAWPAPPAPADAIDDQEHDLAVLRRLLDDPDRDAVKGHAHYLLKLNECLRRSVRDRWSKGERRWSPSDGLTRVSARVTAALAPHRLTARAYSLTALQRFSACPYQFVLAAIYRLRPLEQPEPLQRMDPLSRGSIFHAIQKAFFDEL